MELLRTVKVEDMVLYKVEDVFALLRVGSYRRQLDTLQAGDYDKNWNAVTLRGLLKIVFSSRSDVAGEVQDWVIANMLNSTAPLSMKATQPAPVAQEHASVHAPVQQPTAKQARPAKEIDSRVPPLLEALSKTAPAKAADARGCIERAAVKGHIPDAAWVTFQYDQIAAIVTDEVATMSEFKSLKVERDPDAKW